ncbi:MAG: PLP-dependent transferase [Planctomycetota bacterium]
MPDRSIDTKRIHAGEPQPRILGAVSMPIFQTAMYESAGEARYDDVRYIRLNNTPNHLVLHDKLASIENGEAALVTSSGMAAISTALFAVLRSGDHLLVQNCLYGGTHELVTEIFPRLGISHDFIAKPYARTPQRSKARSSRFPKPGKPKPEASCSVARRVR